MHNRQVPYLSVDAFFFFYPRPGLSRKCQITKEKAVTVYRSNLVPCNLTLSLWLHYLFSARGHPWASPEPLPRGRGRWGGHVEPAAPSTGNTIAPFLNFNLPHTSSLPLPGSPHAPLGRVVARLGFLGKPVLTFKTFFLPDLNLCWLILPGFV